MTSAEPFTFGTHNLYDDKGVPTFFADVIIFTEAIPGNIIARARARWAHAKGRLAGYRIVVCRPQRDLVVAVRRNLFKVGGNSYIKYVDSRPKVTPHRGTFLVLATHRETGQHVAIVAEHRINAAFHPWIRGEPVFREKAWKRHTAGTLEAIERLDGSGFRVLAGGDVNTPRNFPGYWDHTIALNEVGEHFDRLAVTPPTRIGDPTVKSRKGSDHPRLIATVRL